MGRRTDADVVEIQGLKPWTSALPALRSNQLSYIPKELNDCSRKQTINPACQLRFFKQPVKLFHDKWRLQFRHRMVMYLPDPLPVQADNISDFCQLV